MRYSENGSRLATVTDHGIYGFFGEYRFLSNFHVCPVYYEGFIYSSSEAAYMACKTKDMNIRKQLTGMKPSEARALGQTIELIPNWEIIKVLKMTEVVYSKFDQNDELKEFLVNFTRNKYLEETNDWNDKFWGADMLGQGYNMLGNILMTVRDKLL